MSDTKRQVNFIPADRGACGYYRMIKPAELLYDYPDVDVTISEPSVYRLPSRDVLFVQRLLKEDLMKDFIQYKGNTKVIVDFDDAIFGKNVKIPEYNYKSDQIDVNVISSNMRNYLDKLADHVIVSTEHLKEVVSEYIPNERITVIPNCLKYSDWYFPYKDAPRDLSFFFAGSDTHYHDKKRMRGDFSDALVNYLEDKRVGVMGTKPQCLMKRYMAYPPVNMFKYAPYFYQYAGQYRFIIAPLEENEFNKSKSDLKYLESCAVGRVCLCTDFPGSPYENAHPLQKIPFGASEKEIKDIVRVADQNYNEILKYQYKYLQGRWLDNHLIDYLNVLDKV